jgi:hypothetical protein
MCHGRAKRLRPGYVGFSFTCGESEDVTGFVLRANRTVHLVEDPSEAFGCARRTSSGRVTRGPSARTRSRLRAGLEREARCGI